MHPREPSCDRPWTEIARYKSEPTAWFRGPVPERAVAGLEMGSAATS